MYYKNTMVKTLIIIGTVKKMDFISDLEYGGIKKMDDYEEKECRECGHMTNAYEGFIVGLDEFYCPDCCPEEYGE